MDNQGRVTNFAELKRLAEAIHGKGTTVEMLSRWAQFEAACKPELILALIAENERLAVQVRLAGVAADATVHEAVGRAATGYLVLAAERDQLKSAVDSLSEAVRGAIKYVAFAFDQGMEGAEPAGFAMEDAVAKAGQL